MARPRVIISSDIGGNDKDDAQSLIHALLYSNDVDYRGIVVTRTDDGGRGGIGDGAAMAREIVDAYGQDLDALRNSDGDYPSAGALRGTIRDGATNPEWPGGVSDGARLIIEEAREASPSDPLYVLTWGPIHDAARALREAPEIVDSVRLIAIDGRGQDRGNQDAYDWLMDAVRTDSRYEDLWMIDSAETFRGIHVDRNGAKNPGQDLGWVKENAAGHGALGELLVEKYTDDLYGRPSSPDGLKMGDTPSLLYLLDGANDDNPGASSWGGSFEKSGIGPNMWTDKSGGSQRMGEFDGARTVHDKKGAVLDDFAERLDTADGGGSGSRPDTSEPQTEPTGQGSDDAETDRGDLRFDSGDTVEIIGEREEGGDTGGEAGPTSPSGSSGDGIGTGRTELEDLSLRGYDAEERSGASGGAWIETGGRDGTVSGRFDGAGGEYTAEVFYFNEPDGVSEWRMKVDGETVARWDGSDGNASMERMSAEIDLEQGDTIEIVGQRGGGEHARLDALVLTPADDFFG